MRVVVEFAKKHERPVVKAGVIGDKFYTKRELIQLAALPSRARCSQVHTVATGTPSFAAMRRGSPAGDARGRAEKKKQA